MTFIDDCTHYVWIYVLKNKHEVFRTFTEWKSLVEKSSGHKIKVFRTDNGGEYTSTEFESLLRKEGIKHEYTIPKTPQQNGVSERMNRTLVEAVRSMLADSRLPHKFWAEALSTATYLVNRSPTKALDGKTPFEAWNGKKPNVNHLRVFGCAAFSHVSKEDRKKPRPKGAFFWDMELKEKAIISMIGRIPVLSSVMVLSLMSPREELILIKKRIKLLKLSYLVMKNHQLKC